MSNAIYCLGFFTFIWVLAVYKVFLSENTMYHPVIGPPAVDVGGMKPNFGVNINKHKLKKFVSHHDAVPSKALVSKATNIKIPKSSEWIFIRSSSKYQVESEKDFEKPVTLSVIQHQSPIVPISRPEPPQAEVQVANPPNTLQWPPVGKDGKIPVNDGSETMPVTKLEVPKFWSAPEGSDLNTVGSKVDGQETIFLMIASYRDFQCRETITSAFARADHPERLFVGAVDQTVPGDIGCLDIEVPCSVNADQPICKYRDQISIYHMDAQYATGPVTARHVGDRMYRGQYFVMQMDAHCLFVRHWDTQIIEQWRSTGNEMAVLSSYLTDVQGSIDANFDSTRNTRPIMCNSDFEGNMPARYLRHGAQPEDVPEIHDMPQLQPFWAAGFSFSRGHFKLRVPYDAYQPMVFQGEEIEIGIRGFTYGYDFYAPRYSVVFHEYAVKSPRRNKVHMFWENNAHAGEGQKSLRRATSIIHMAPDIDPSTWDHSELDKYGLGTVRPLDQFYKLFLINVQERKATQLCPFVKSGVMHHAFQPLLRSDRLGIDYSQLLNYDTAKVLEDHFAKQHPYWEKRIRDCLASNSKIGLQEAITSADKIGLSKKLPDLIAEAKKLLQS